MMGRSRSDSCAPVTIPFTTAVAGVGGPGKDTVWLPAPEEAISSRINLKHCREFQAFAKEQIQPVPVVMHRDIVAGLDSTGNESQRKGTHCTGG